VGVLSRVAQLPFELQKLLSEIPAERTRDPKRAFYSLLAHLRRYPSDPPILYEMGRLSQHIGELSLTSGYLSQALSSEDEDESKAREAYLEVLIQRGCYLEVISTGLRWLRATPSDASLHTMTGYGIEKERGFTEALTYYQRAAELGDHARFSHFLLMRATSKVHGPEPSLALALKHMSLYPSDPNSRAWELCAELFEASGSALSEPERARKTLIAYERAIQGEPLSYRAHYQLGLRYERSDQARAYRHATLAQGEGAPLEACLLLCRLELERGERGSARYALDRYHQLAEERLIEPSGEAQALSERLGLRKWARR